jgi:uncharacterized membrane protein
MVTRESQHEARRFRWIVGVALGVTATALAIYFAGNGPGGVGPLVLAASAVFLSKLAIFGGNLRNTPISPWELAFIAWVIDVWLASALLAGIASFDRLPLAGRALAEAHERTRQTLREFPGLRRLAFWAVVLVVGIPLPVFGVIPGTLLGRLVGLSRTATFASVLLGSGGAVAACATIAVFLGARYEAWLTDPFVLLGCIAGLALLAWAAWLKVKRELQRR